MLDNILVYRSMVSIHRISNSIVRYLRSFSLASINNHDENLNVTASSYFHDRNISRYFSGRAGSFFLSPAFFYLVICPK